MGDAVPAASDICVVGGGIVGIATARELQLRHPGARVLVIEREPALATHQSGHSSGVIHAGIYYAPGSLKARLCVAGAARLYAYCEERGIEARREGKVIVATEQSELPRLDELERRGTANAVPGLRRIGPDELREIEPHASRPLGPPLAGDRRRRLPGRDRSDGRRPARRRGGDRDRL